MKDGGPITQASAPAHILDRRQIRMAARVMAKALLAALKPGDS
jgi:hypothetical protein